MNSSIVSARDGYSVQCEELSFYYTATTYRLPLWIQISRNKVFKRKTIELENDSKCSIVFFSPKFNKVGVAHSHLHPSATSLLSLHQYHWVTIGEYKLAVKRIEISKKKSWHMNKVSVTHSQSPPTDWIPRQIEHNFW